MVKDDDIKQQEQKIKDLREKIKRTLGELEDDCDISTS